MANLPLELLYQIALHLPSTRDVLTFSLTHSRVREALSTPALFKERLALQGWDVSAWLEEDRNVVVPRSLQEDQERWMRIDQIYFRTVQLFDEAAIDNPFSESPPDADSDRDTSEPELEQSNLEVFDDIAPLHPFRLPALQDPLLLRQKTVVWLRKLSEVLPAFLTHHRAFLDALFCRVLLFRILAFWRFRWRKRPANYRSQVSWCSLDLCEGPLIFQLRRRRRKIHGFRDTKPCARASEVVISLV